MADSSPNSLEPQDSDATRLAEEVKDLISNLESQLRKAQKLYARLQDLPKTERTAPPVPTSFKVLDIRSSPNAPIHRCPTEVLFMIFGHALNPSHVHIRSLLLVCKHWYRIVINNPQLWTQIRYAVPEDSMKGHWHVGAASYVSACMLRSRGLPLHLELDLQNLQSKGDYIMRHMMDSAKEILDKFNFPTLENAVADQLSSEVSLVEWEINCKAYNDSLSRACEIFFGERCCNGERWTSLSLILPLDEPTAVLVWRKLTSAANLKRLVMENVPIYYTDDGELIDAGPKELPLLEFISCTSPDALPLKMFRTLPTSVKHFSLWFREGVRELQALSYHTNLHSLELTGIDSWHKDVPATKFCIQLPKLQVLKLNGCYGQLRSFDLEFPALKTLVIQSDTAELAPLPKLSPLLIQWIINTDDSTPDARIIYTSITQLALFSVTTTGIFLPSFGMHSSLACLGQLKKEGKLATRPALVHIFGRHPNGSMRKVDIEALGEEVARRQSIDEAAKVESSASSQSASTQQTT